MGVTLQPLEPRPHCPSGWTFLFRQCMHTETHHKWPLATSFSLRMMLLELISVLAAVRTSLLCVWWTHHCSHFGATVTDAVSIYTCRDSGQGAPALNWPWSCPHKTLSPAPVGQDLNLAQGDTL